jgi:hypothetical protein
MSASEPVVIRMEGLTWPAQSRRVDLRILAPSVIRDSIGPEGAFMSETRVAGAILLGIALVVATAIVLVAPQGATYGIAVTASPPENLRAIADLGNTWLQAMGLLTTAIILEAIGLSVLTGALFGAGSGRLAPAALVTFLMAAVLFVVWLVLEASATVWAAQTVKSTGSAPVAFEAFDRAEGVLFVLFMALAYGAIALFGLSILRVGQVGHWAGWVSLVLGGIGLVARLSDLSMLGVPPWVPAGNPGWMLAGVPGWIPLWGILMGVAAVTAHPNPSARYPSRLPS